MDRNEIIRLIVERLEDHNVIVSEEEIASEDYITLEYATSLLEDYKHDDSLIADDDFGMPKEATPELFMEAYNCRIRLARHIIMKNEYTKWMKNIEPLDVYESYCIANNKSFDVIYTDYLLEDVEFPFTPDDLTMLDLIELGQHSPDFDSNKKFCWYEIKNNNPNCINNALHSTNTPFADGVIDADEIAEWLLQNPSKLATVDYKYHDTVPNCWPWED